jgi:hypothetical protein
MSVGTTTAPSSPRRWGRLRRRTGVELRGSDVLTSHPSSRAATAAGKMRNGGEEQAVALAERDRGRRVGGFPE